MTFRQDVSRAIWHHHLHCFVPLDKGECLECEKAIDRICAAAERMGKRIELDQIDQAELVKETE